MLWKKRDESNDEGVREQNNAELTYAIRFNLANQYHLNKLYSDALRVYDSIVRDPKRFNQAGQLRANMGNIYFEQGASAAQGSKAQADYYNQAIKQYRMALDNVPSSSSTARGPMLLRPRAFPLAHPLAHVFVCPWMRGGGPHLPHIALPAASKRSPAPASKHSISIAPSADALPHRAQHRARPRPPGQVQRRDEHVRGRHAARPGHPHRV